MVPRFGVGIENGAARERERERERESELEAVDRITGIQRGQEITAREGGRVFCKWLGGGSTAPRSISDVNVREGITWSPFREGPVWDPRCQELDTLRIVV